MDIKKHIPKGRENAVNLGTLCDRLGLGQTAIKRAIREERKKGTPILSGREGYWISTDREEIERFNNLLRGQALARFATIKGIKTGAGANDGNRES